MFGTVRGRIASWGKQLLADLAGEPTGPRIRPWLWIIIPIVLLAGSTIVIRLTDLDFTVQETIYLAGGESWKFGEHPFWKGLYYFGSWLPALIVLLSLVGLVLGFSRERFRKWRKVFLFAILLAITGPGVVTNGILKPYWGRPRPLHVEGLGGHDAFEPILTVDRASKGKSFPCGHATMGFYFLGGFFLLRRHRRELAEGFLFFGLVAGSLIGVARMVQGAHFLSDVIWAAGVCYFSALGLYYALRLDRSLVLPARDGKRTPLVVKAGATLAGVIVLGGILIATPYREDRDYRLRNDYAMEGPMRVHLTFVTGENDIVAGEEFRVSGEAFGHGTPTAQIAINYVEFDLEDHVCVVYQERRSGWFAEVDGQLEVSIPWERTRELLIDSEEARTWVKLPETRVDSAIEAWRGAGSFYIETGGHPWHREGEEPAERPSIEIRIDEEFEGKVEVDGVRLER